MEAQLAGIESPFLEHIQDLKSQMTKKLLKIVYQLFGPCLLCLLYIYIEPFYDLYLGHQVSGPSAPACCQLTAAQMGDLRSLHLFSFDCHLFP